MISSNTLHRYSNFTGYKSQFHYFFSSQELQVFGMHILLPSIFIPRNKMGSQSV